MTCPLCGKTAQEKYKPFCSLRCADLDLGKWLNGAYSVPVVEDDDLPDDMDESPEDPIY
jgi:endogenous inhibitor of DNA gyrase (YacG/DUF329 family)